MAGLEKSKKASKKQKIDRRSNLEQGKIKNLIHRSEVCKIENKKGKKIRRSAPLERGASEGRRRDFSHPMFYQEKSPKDRTPLEKGVPEGRRIDFSHPIIFPISNTIEGFPIATYKKAPATRIGASGISICIAFR